MTTGGAGLALLTLNEVEISTAATGWLPGTP